MEKEPGNSTTSPIGNTEELREGYELKWLYGTVNKLERNKSFQNMKSWTSVRQIPVLGLNASPACCGSGNRSKPSIENI